MLKIFINSLIIFVFNLPLLFVIQAINEQPLSFNDPTLNQAQVANIQQLLIDHDPRLLINSSEQIIKLTESESNALINYFKDSVVNQQNLNLPFDLTKTAIVTRLSTNSLNLSVSIPVMETPFGQYINFDIVAVEHDNFMRFESIKMGDLLIPAVIQEKLLSLTTTTLENETTYQLLTELQRSIKQVSLLEDSIEFNLNWQTNTIANIQEQARKAFISQEEANRFREYYGLLIEIANGFPQEQRTAKLNDFLIPMFSAANKKTVNGADPIAENRAVLVVMATYVTEINMQLLIGTTPDEIKLPEARKINITVGTRRDLAQHIIGSAAIASAAGADIADILSIYKEVHDSRYRSGFSFSDITANEVGTALGSLAAESPEIATQLQLLLMNSSAENDYMPAVDRSDGITEEEFITQYGSRRSPAYQLRLTEIRQKIDEGTLFQAVETFRLSL